MTLGDIIKEYRSSHKMSMDAFSDKSGISKAYISLLEKNKHPKTGKAITPSIQCIKQAADGMDMDFNVLFGMIEGNVSLTDNSQKTEVLLSRRDERDISRRLEKTLDDLENQQDALMFDGAPMDDQTRELLKASLENSIRIAKINAKKFTPKKYLHTDEKQGE